jgi:hypothetical protein
MEMGGGRMERGEGGIKGGGWGEGRERKSYKEVSGGGEESREIGKIKVRAEGRGGKGEQEREGREGERGGGRKHDVKMGKWQRMDVRGVLCRCHRVICLCVCV